MDNFSLAKVVDNMEASTVAVMLHAARRKKGHDHKLTNTPHHNSVTICVDVRACRITICCIQRRDVCACL